MKFNIILLSALKLGVGFSGIFLLFDNFVKKIAPALEMIISIRGLNYPILDIGWPPLAGIIWDSSIAPFTIPILFFVRSPLTSIESHFEVKILAREFK